MKRWIENGVRLAWLIDAENKAAYIYRTDNFVSKINSFSEVLSGEDVLPGFSFDLSILV